MTDTTNHAENLRRIIESTVECDCCYVQGGLAPGCARHRAITALDALTRELEDAKEDARLWHESEKACSAQFDKLLDENRAQAARIATLEEALTVAKEAMDERRSYVNGGDPSGCWQEMKYGEAWDEEDTRVAAALAPSKGER